MALGEVIQGLISLDPKCGCKTQVFIVVVMDGFIDKYVVISKLSKQPGLF